MIETTKDQAKSAYHKFCEERMSSTNEPETYMINTLNSFIGSLTKEQRIALVEEVGLSVVERVELDAENIKTFPMVRAFIMTNNGLRRFEKIKGIYCFTTERQTHIGNKTVVDNDVTHWCELPQLNECVMCNV